MAAYDPEARTDVERITLGNYASQIQAEIERLTQQLDRIDGGRPEMAKQTTSESLTASFHDSATALTECADRLSEIAARLGSIL